GAPQGEELGLMKPLSDSSINCSANSFVSEGANRYGARANGVAPEILSPLPPLAATGHRRPAAAAAGKFSGGPFSGEPKDTPNLPIYPILHATLPHSPFTPPPAPPLLLPPPAPPTPLPSLLFFVLFEF
nr:hypothetical protein [Tanacetum cinerariifolium]